MSKIINNKPYIGKPMYDLTGYKKGNIHQRILKVMEEVSYLQKKGNAAKEVTYKFITHDQVTKALHMPCVKNGIIALTTIEEFVQEGNRTRVKVKVSFINADNPKDFVEVISYGYGIDQQDKGIGKAVSYATKYAYLKCFMLETGDDPEKDNIDFSDEEKESYISKAEYHLLMTFIDKSSNPQETIEYYLKALKISSLEEMPKEKFQGVFESLKRKYNGGEKV